MPVLASISGSIVNEIAHFVRTGGLPGIFVLMAISSACIPIPSEAVMLFAGFVVAGGRGPGEVASAHHLSMVGIVLAGVLGTIVGSWITYAVGRGGRLELLERHGGKLHISPAQIGRADRWFARYGQSVVLFGRLVPFVRAFVSLPAGVAKMPFVRFTVLSLIGAIPWTIGLAVAGDAVGAEWTKIRSAFDYVDYAVAALLVAGIVYLVAKWVRRPRPAQQPDGGESLSPSPGADTAG
ncbi:MAG: DedA family protein [Solirubrobacteraceae bacterium]